MAAAQFVRGLILHLQADHDWRKCCCVLCSYTVQKPQYYSVEPCLLCALTGWPECAGLLPASGCLGNPGAAVYHLRCWGQLPFLALLHCLHAVTSFPLLSPSRPLCALVSSCAELFLRSELCRVDSWINQIFKL